MEKRQLTVEELELLDLDFDRTNMLYPKLVTEMFKSLKPQTEQQEVSKRITAPANINLSDYIQVPQHGILIAKEVTLKGKNWKDTHYELADSGLFMPRIDYFMTHFLSVKEAAKGRRKLYDGNNSPIDRREAEDLWNHFSSRTNRTKGTCWTWLDALFKKDPGGNLEIETDHRFSGTGANRTSTSNSLSLSPYLPSDGLAELSFNKEGLAEKVSLKSEYSQGENIYFYYPRENSVAWFGADSDRADLGCNGNPAVANSALGVFACAEGAGAQKI